MLFALMWSFYSPSYSISLLHFFTCVFLHASDRRHTRWGNHPTHPTWSLAAACQVRRLHYTRLVCLSAAMKYNEWCHETSGSLSKTHVSVCLPDCLYIFQSVCPSVCLSIRLPARLWSTWVLYCSGYNCQLRRLQQSAPLKSRQW